MVAPKAVGQEPHGSMGNDKHTSKGLTSPAPINLRVTVPTASLVRKGCTRDRNGILDRGQQERTAVSMRQAKQALTNTSLRLSYPGARLLNACGRLAWTISEATRRSLRTACLHTYSMGRRKWRSPSRSNTSLFTS
jgi:hypothetical protein